MEIAKKQFKKVNLCLKANPKEITFSEAGRVYQDSQDLLYLLIEGMLTFALQFKTICN